MRRFTTRFTRFIGIPFHGPSLKRRRAGETLENETPRETLSLSRSTTIPETERLVQSQRQGLTVVELARRRNGARHRLASAGGGQQGGPVVEQRAGTTSTAGAVERGPAESRCIGIRQLVAGQLGAEPLLGDQVVQ
jgi:hypothetical protein